MQKDLSWPPMLVAPLVKLATKAHRHSASVGPIYAETRQICVLISRSGGLHVQCRACRPRQPAPIFRLPQATRQTPHRIKQDLPRCCALRGRQKSLVGYRRRSEYRLAKASNSADHFCNVLPTGRLSWLVLEVASIETPGLLVRKDRH